MTDGTLYGYDHRLTQPCVVARGTVQIPPHIDPDQQRRWLKDIFACPDHYLERFDAVEHRGDAQEQRIRRILGLGIILSNALLRQSAIPLYDIGKVLTVTPAPDGQPDNHAFAVALPACDGVPPAIILNGYGSTLRLMTDMLTGEPDYERIMPLLEQLFEKGIKPIGRRVSLSTDGVASAFAMWKCEVPQRELGNGLKRVGWGAKGRLMKVSAIQADAAIASTMVKNKAHTAAFLRGLGLPAAEHAVVDTAEKALAAASKIGWPLVVKPASAERSMGVTIDITDEETVKTAFAEAQKYSKHVLIERRVKGFCYRIAVCGERILFARAHMPKGVKADGKHTVTELAEMATQSREKMPPWLMKKPFVIDDLARSTLASDGLTPESIPAEGQFVRLRPILREDWGAEFETLTDRIHPDNVAAAVTACKAMGLTMGGVDLITPDITVPWHKNGAIINEINYMPQVLKDIDDDARAAVARVALQGEGDGRIPIHFVTGDGDRDAAARDLRSQLAGEGETCHLVSTEICEDPEGKALPLRGLGTLFERVLAMLGRPDVESLIVAAPADTFVQSGWPVDRLAKVHVLAADDGAAEATWQAIDARIVTGGFARL